MTRKFLLCIRWYAAGLILTYTTLQLVPSSRRSGAARDTPETGDFVSAKHPVSSAASTDEPSLASHSGGEGPPVLPKVETDNDLLMVLMDEELRPLFLGNAEALRKLPISNWHDVTRFCLYNLNWSREDLENAIAPEARPLLRDHQLNNDIYRAPEKAWDTLSRPEAWKPDHPTLFDREVLLWRASETIAKAEPERFLKDLPSLPEESRARCLWEAVPGLMSALEPSEAVAAVRAQLEALPAKDHREVLHRVFDTALLHPSGEEAVREMLETLPEGPERESLKEEFEQRRFAATRDDPLQ